MERPEFYEALGRTIRVLRADRSVDRKDLAESVGISYSYLAGIENGKKRPSSSVLLRIARALGLRSHELMEAAETRADRTAAGDAPPTAAHPAMPAPSQRAAWFHRQESESDEAFLFQTPPPSPPRLRSADLFVNRISEIADDLTDEDHRLILETARRLAERHTGLERQPDGPSDSGTGTAR
jgi:transcriptional regulator with XRE-family HTH domain